MSMAESTDKSASPAGVSGVASLELLEHYDVTVGQGSGWPGWFCRRCSTVRYFVAAEEWDTDRSEDEPVRRIPVTLADLVAQAVEHEAEIHDGAGDQS